ncbi:hypothetical protein LSTR_LSTR014733 [Laodelphax striatellus]|uniref:Uncharacterized protein n=1 Tax=Laodelphax striatellus TaxID=195883 RepID=A0A482WIP1_LAOST|nr:hypothetical protein LSTR_LSTR014733 [Laodelphax striatellus]
MMMTEGQIPEEEGGSMSQQNQDQHQRKQLLPTNQQQVITVQHFQAPAPSNVIATVNPDSARSTTKEEEWVTKKKVELTTKRQIETRVKRQVVLEDGRVVEDSGPIVTTNTTEDTEKQESTTTEKRDLAGDGDGDKSGDKRDRELEWAESGGGGALATQDGLLREVKEKKACSRQETSELLETEDVTKPAATSSFINVTMKSSKSPVPATPPPHDVINSSHNDVIMRTTSMSPVKQQHRSTHETTTSSMTPNRSNQTSNERYSYSRSHFDRSDLSSPVERPVPTANVSESRTWYSTVQRNGHGGQNGHSGHNEHSGHNGRAAMSSEEEAASPSPPVRPRRRRGQVTKPAAISSFINVTMKSSKSPVPATPPPHDVINSSHNGVIMTSTSMSPVKQQHRSTHETTTSSMTPNRSNQTSNERHRRADIEHQ